MTAEPIRARQLTAYRSPTGGPAGLCVDGPGQAAAPRLLGVIWALLILNTLGPSTDIALIPHGVAQIITTLAVVLAFALALLINPRVRIRPNAFLFLLTLLVLDTTIATLFLGPGLGAFARLTRLIVLIATLWLLTPHWHDSAAFVRHHRRALAVVVASVVGGLCVAPGRAISENGRLGGILWGIPATQVGQYSAVLLGLTLLLWMAHPNRQWRGTLGLCIVALGALLLTHTRTAIVAMLVGLALSGLVLMTISTRARRAIFTAVITVAALWVAFGAAVMTWFQRGQTAAELQDLSGRQAFWDNLLADPRTGPEKIFGLGINHKSFAGLPIDSGWFTIYNEQGIAGVVIAGAFCAALVGAAIFRRSSTARACAVFLIAYCLAASYTEVGLGDASPYLLHLYVAAVLLAASPNRRPGAPTTLPLQRERRR